MKLTISMGMLKLHISACTFAYTFQVEERVQAKQPYTTVLSSHQAVQETQTNRNRLTSLFELFPNKEVNAFIWLLSSAELN